MNTPNPNPSPELLQRARMTLADARIAAGSLCGDCPDDVAVSAMLAFAALSPQTLPAPGEVEHHFAGAGKPIEVERIRRAIWGYVNAQPEDAATLPVVQFLANRDVFLAEALTLATVAAANDEGVRSDDETIAEFSFLYRQYGLEDDSKLAPDALELKRKVLAAIAPTLATGVAADVPTMPECDDRALWSDDEPSGYLESDRDWSERNSDVITWLIDNHAAIRLLSQGGGK